MDQKKLNHGKDSDHKRSAPPFLAIPKKGGGLAAIKV